MVINHLLNGMFYNTRNSLFHFAPRAYRASAFARSGRCKSYEQCTHSTRGSFFEAQIRWGRRCETRENGIDYGLGVGCGWNRKSFSWGKAEVWVLEDGGVTMQFLAVVHDLKKNRMSKINSWFTDAFPCISYWTVLPSASTFVGFMTPTLVRIEDEVGSDKLQPA